MSKRKNNHATSVLWYLFSEKVWGRVGWGCGGGRSRGKEGVRRRTTGGLATELQRWGRCTQWRGAWGSAPFGEPSRKAWGSWPFAGSCGLVSLKPTFSWPHHSEKHHPRHFTATLYACLILVLDGKLIFGNTGSFSFSLHNLGRFCLITWFKCLLLDLREVSELSLPPPLPLSRAHMPGRWTPSHIPFPREAFPAVHCHTGCFPALCLTLWGFSLLVRPQYIPPLIFGYFYGLLMCTLSLPLKQRPWCILRAFPLLPCLAECNTHRQMGSLSSEEELNWE